ncbi:MAG TPA: EamA family transporter [Terriglobia bacterium]|nr:EamA family transporter [Terriglobia bacterium]
MTSPRNLQSRTYAMLVPVILFAPLGNVLLGKGMRQTGELHSYSPAEVLAFFRSAFTSPWVWLGIACLLMFLVSYMIVLSWADYSFVMPVSAITYGVAALMGHWLLGEIVTPQRWLGVAVICFGVALVTRTPSSSRVQE